jgi:glycosyltransferase involved in cell wall biosynthesis
MRLAIVTQDPGNRGGVLRLVEYAFGRARQLGMEPALVHYGAFRFHPALSASVANLLRAELNFTAESARYEFESMPAVAIGAVLPEFEPNRLHANALWRRHLDEFDRFFVITGSAQTGLPLAELHKPFSSWISATVSADRQERLKHDRSLSSFLERRTIRKVYAAEMEVLEASAGIYAVSEKTREELRPFTPKAQSVLPFPIDTAFWNPDTAERREPRLIFVGRASDARKRFDLFINTVAHVRAAMPKATAVVVSADLPRRMKLPDGVTHSAGLSNEELRELYRTSTAFMLTSEQEGLGIAAMEAMACGLPVVSTRCGGPETYIIEGVNGYFTDDEPHELAQCVLDLLRNSSTRARMASAAAERIQSDFSERVWNPKFDEILASLPT